VTYDLKSLKVPRLAGAPLRTMVSLMERSSTRQLLAPALVKELGTLLFKSAAVNGEPTFLPIHPAGRSMGAAQARTTLAFYEQPTFSSSESVLPSTLDIANAYRNGNSTPTAVAEAVINSIKASNEGNIPLNAIISSNENDILRQAEASEKRLASGQPLGILEGIPIAIKDEIDALPYPTQVGSAVISNGEPVNMDATVLARLRADGAVIIGKTNMHEIGIGVSGANITFGHCHNPYNLKHFAGGSSGGSAAAVAAGLCPIALGADGGGSIRIPAALCGMVGLKPTWGRVSEYGAFPLCNSLAHIGPIGRTVDDVALAYSVIAGSDLLDAASCQQPNVHLSDYLNHNLSDIKLGIYTPWFSHADRDIVQQCQLAVEKLKGLKASVREVEVEQLNLQRIAHAITITSEMRAAVDKLHREQREQFAPDTRLLLALSKLFTGTDYVKAQQIRTQTIRGFERIFLETDIIVTPMTAITAPRIKRPQEDDAETSLSTTTELMRYSFSSNLAGLPSLSLPAGYTDKGLPIGLQLIGKPWQEHQLLRVAKALENTITTQSGALAFDLLSRS